MVLRFSYLKQIRGNQSTYSGAAVTTYLQADNILIQPLGSTGAATAAPSTIIIDKETKDQYFLNKAFSATHAAMTAVTSGSDAVNLF